MTFIPGPYYLAVADAQMSIVREVTMILRPYRPSDEGAALAARAELAEEGLEFLWGFSPSMSWQQYLQVVADYDVGHNLPDGHVRTALLVAEDDAHLVGRISVRYELNDFLLARGGHIGYAVRPAFRRRGYATEILRQGLGIAHDHGIDPVLVTCDDTNVASATVIERGGGVLASVFEESDGARYRRYWIHSTR
jgi:predicted acetyltransferase